MDIAPHPDPGRREVLDADDFQLNFTLGTAASYRTLVVVSIYQNVKGGSLPLYYLPWHQNAATELTIPAGGPDIFMTSMLSGCTVQVHGTAANPTITHANSRQSYEAGYYGTEAALQGQQGLDPELIHIQSETAGNLQCDAAINAMLPAGPNSRQVRKVDYAGRVQQRYIDAAKARYYATLGPRERFTTYKPETSGQFKPITGAFVYGKRDVHNRWSFYFQAAVSVKIFVAPYFGWGASTEHKNESALLGPPTQFFP
jgi:hypothetical protein